MVYDMAKIWVEASCPIPKVRVDLLRHLKEALDRGVGCSFLLGSDLTLGGKPTMVYCFCGELFTFELTADQAQNLRLEPGLLVASRGLSQQDHESRPEPLVRLNRVDVVNGHALDRRAPIEAVLTYQTDRWWQPPLIVRVTCEPAGCTRKVLYHHLHSLLPGEKTIPVSLSGLDGLQDRHGQPLTGILPLFFEVCQAEAPEKEPETGPLSLTPPQPQAGFPAMGSLPGPFGLPLGQPSQPPEYESISDIRAVVVEIL